ncbi:unnamed protein product, partial [Rotaria magnacalcarata]
PSLLATNPSDELKAITDSQPIPSRPSSAVLKKPPKIDCRRMYKTKQKRYFCK